MWFSCVSLDVVIAEMTHFFPKVVDKSNKVSVIVSVYL